MLSQAEEGLKLFAKEPIITFDTEAAANFKLVHEAGIKEIESQAEQLTGKANKNKRSELGKQVMQMKADPIYIDACKVLKERESPNGNFMTKIEQGPEKATSGPTAAPEPDKAPEPK